jgi:hypothetical protein
MLVNAAHGEFKKVGLASPKKLKSGAQATVSSQAPLTLEVEMTDEVAEILGLEDQKTITIEREPETVQEKKNLPDMRLESEATDHLESLRAVFQSLKRLTDFQELHHGEPH